VTIGGYFELELRNGPEYHRDAARLNTATNAFEIVLRGKKPLKVYLPYYICDVLLRPLKQLGIDYMFYSVNEFLEPKFDYSTLRENEAFLAVNYFGLKDALIKDLGKMVPNLIVDNAQSFFSFPIIGVDSFYSARKFFGVPDGAYLYTNTTIEIDQETDKSFDRMAHLLLRIDNDPESGYSYYRANESRLRQTPIRNMSMLTSRLLKNINYQESAKKRIKNYRFLQDNLGVYNRLSINWDAVQVPMVYPFYSQACGLRERLIENNIFVAQYWKNVISNTEENSLESHLARELVPLPIDQRYSTHDMERIVFNVLKILQSR
jgi:hypothetical protein